MRRSAATSSSTSRAVRKRAATPDWRQVARGPGADGGLLVNAQESRRVSTQIFWSSNRPGWPGGSRRHQQLSVERARMANRSSQSAATRVPRCGRAAHDLSKAVPVTSDATATRAGGDRVGPDGRIVNHGGGCNPYPNHERGGSAVCTDDEPDSSVARGRRCASKSCSLGPRGRLRVGEGRGGGGADHADVLRGGARRPLVRR